MAIQIHDSFLDIASGGQSEHSDSEGTQIAGDVTPTDLYFKTVTTANTQKRMNDQSEGKPQGPSGKVIQFPGNK